MNILRRLVTDNGCCVIMATHARELHVYADEILILNGGKLEKETEIWLGDDQIVMIILYSSKRKEDISVYVALGRPKRIKYKKETVIRKALIK